MFSLPDINRLNSDAQNNKRRLTAQAARIMRGKATEDEKCEHCEERLATSATPYFDIFSEDPKGLVLECEKCREQYGMPEGYFECDSCQRLMALNYTWELYRHVDEDGTDLCLPCYAQREIADESNWMRLTDEDIAVVTFDTLRKVKHLLAVRAPVPMGIEFVGNVEVDSATGGTIRSSTYADPTPDGAVAELREILTRAKNDGHQRAILVLDGHYEFAVSIGVYVPAATDVKQRAKGRGRKAVQ